MKDKKAKSKGSDKSGDTVKGQPVKAGPFPELVSCAKPPKEVRLSLVPSKFALLSPSAVHPLSKVLHIKSP